MCRPFDEDTKHALLECPDVSHWWKIFLPKIDAGRGVPAGCNPTCGFRNRKVPTSSQASTAMLGAYCICEIKRSMRAKHQPLWRMPLNKPLMWPPDKSHSASTKQQPKVEIGTTT